MPANLDAAVSTPFSEYIIPVETARKAAIVNATNPKRLLSNTGGLLSPIHRKNPEHKADSRQTIELLKEFTFWPFSDII